MPLADYDAHLFEKDPVAVAEMILLLRRKGIREKSVVAALEKTPRRLFLPSERHQVAHRDRPQPIECGQFISAPSTVGMMTEALDVRPGHRVLQIGTGSGYQAAILAQMGAKVFTVERYSGLVELSRQRFAALRLNNITSKLADGTQGWSDGSMFDRILLSGSVERIPQCLLAQLAPGGVVVAPVGGESGAQQIIKLESTNDSLLERQVGAGRFTPLCPGRAHVL